jgi:hypothetical protein
MTHPADSLACLAPGVLTSGQEILLNALPLTMNLGKRRWALRSDVLT